VPTALDEVRTAGLRVRPLCWFVAGWIDRHPDYRNLLDDSPASQRSN
jgi:predicted GNAT family acetyltransferase